MKFKQYTKLSWTKDYSLITKQTNAYIKYKTKGRTSHLLQKKSSYTDRNKWYGHLSIQLNGRINITNIYNRHIQLNNDEVVALAETSKKTIIVGNFNARHSDLRNLANNTAGYTLCTLVEIANLIALLSRYPHQILSQRQDLGGNRLNAHQRTTNLQHNNISRLEIRPQAGVLWTYNKRAHNDRRETSMKKLHKRWLDALQKIPSQRIKINRLISITQDIDTKIQNLTYSINQSTEKYISNIQS